MRNPHGLISVIMPCYNAGPLLAESVNSVLAQTYPDVELIVIDDGSTDGSDETLLALAHRDKRIIPIVQANAGAGPARNVGIARAAGDYIAFLDADDLWEPDCLESLQAALIAEAADLAYCGWQNTGVGPGNDEPFIPPDYASVDKATLLLEGNRWPIHAVLTKAALIRDAGGFDESLSSCMDYDLWLRIAHDHTITRVPKVLAYYRHHDGEQITKNPLRIALNNWRTQQKFLTANPLVEQRLGKAKVRDLTYGELLRRAYDCYWRRDIEPAHAMFRIVMKGGYGSLKDWKYMLPALLPLRAYRWLLNRRDMSALTH